MGKLAVSYSQIKKWRQCKQAHYYAYIERLEPRMKPRPLKMGSVIHDMLEAKARGKDWTEILHKVQKEFDKMFVEEKELYGDIPSDAEKIMKAYERMYGEDDEIDYLLIEEKMGPIDLTDKTALTLRPDALVRDRDQGLIYLMERKTAQRLPTEDFRLWDLQTLIYAWALRKLGYQVDGVLWDHVRSKPPTEPQVLKSGELSQAKKIDTDYYTYYEAIKENGLDPEKYSEFLEKLKGRERNFFRRVRLPVKEKMIKPLIKDAQEASLEIYYMQHRPQRNISPFTCKSCFYKSLCYAELRGLDDNFIRENEFKVKEGGDDEDVSEEEAEE